MELCGDLIDRVLVHINGSQEVMDKKESEIHMDFKTRTKSSSGIRSTQRNNLSLDSGTDSSNIRSALNLLIDKMIEIFNFNII